MEIGKRRSSKERRALAIDAVIDLASGMNPADITTAAISERMGLTQGALFRHFPIRAAVFGRPSWSVSERILFRIDEGSGKGPRRLKALRRSSCARRVHRIEPRSSRLLFSELHDGRDGASAPSKRFSSLAMRILEQLDEAKKFGLGSREIWPSAAMSFFGGVQGLVIQRCCPERR